MLEVYITIDTEVWWQDSSLSQVEQDYARWIQGKTPQGSFGVDYQMQVFNEHNLKAVFFVEPLFSLSEPFLRVDTPYLNQLVQSIVAAGHDAQLHIHTEWLPHICKDSYELPASLWQKCSQADRHEHIRQFSLDEQIALIAVAKHRLEVAGAPHVNAFRAGNFGADNVTLNALARNGILIDSSYNQDFLGRACEIHSDNILLQPALIDQVVEYPVSCFADYPKGVRPAQLGACSFGEMKQALMQAWSNGWQHFVIVLHSFELLNDQRSKPSPINLKRFHKLCEFLATNEDKFRTCTFQQLQQPTPHNGYVGELSGALHHTLWRYGEQAMSRLF